MGNLTLKEARALANANYERGGDYIIELLSDAEIKSMFCDLIDGKRAMYRYMASVEEMRKNLACM